MGAVWQSPNRKLLSEMPRDQASAIQVDAAFGCDPTL